MPTYVYVVVNEDGSEGETFEVVQKMSDPPLSKHPETGQPVRRVILAPNINTRGSGKRYLDPGYQAKHGFTRYEKTGDGTYSKTAGAGPDTIRRD
jgi:predicted nucleic acid-binding Zn ribbon protein